MHTLALAGFGSRSGSGSGFGSGPGFGLGLDQLNGKDEIKRNRI